MCITRIREALEIAASFWRWTNWTEMDKLANNYLFQEQAP